MSEKNPACRIFWDIRTKDITCDNLAVQFPVDMTRIPAGPPCTPAQDSTKNPYCGCPLLPDECYDYTIPATIETRIHRLPLKCVKPPCNYTIPAIPCPPTVGPKPVPEDPLCFDWTVDEPGPNDSYGLNGLNWYDWKMEKYNHDITPKSARKGKLAHPGFSEKPLPPGTKVYMCDRPMECYTADPSPCKPVPFKLDVNYFRDWRCCEALPAKPWYPPCVTWATNQSL